MIDSCSCDQSFHLKGVETVQTGGRDSDHPVCWAHLTSDRLGLEAGSTYCPLTALQVWLGPCIWGSTETQKTTLRYGGCLAGKGKGQNQHLWSDYCTMSTENICTRSGQIFQFEEFHMLFFLKVGKKTFKNNLFLFYACALVFWMRVCL